MACQTDITYRLEMCNDMAVKTGTNTTFLCAADGQTKYTVYDYRFNITGDIQMSYNDQNHLIVKLVNGFIQPAGSQIWPNAKPIPIVWYGSLSGPLPCWRSIAIAASLNYGIPNSGWKKCLGGWYAAGTNCNTTCSKDKYGNPPGGTIMYWADNQAGPAWATNDYQRGGRTIPTLEWDMGPVESQDGQGLKVYIIARAERACAWNRPACENMPWTPSTVPIRDFTAPTCPLPQPVFKGSGCKQHVCEDCVDELLTFEAADFSGLEGVVLVVDYKYGDEDWDVALHYTARNDAVEFEDTTVTLPCCIPDRDIVWRAQYMTTKGTTSKSEYAYGTIHSCFLPPAWMEVPPVSVQECTLIQQGKEVKPFDHLTNYWGEDL